MTDQRPSNSYQGGGRGRDDVAPLPTAEKIKSFMARDDSAADMVHETEALGRRLQQNYVTTSQIRNAYGSMKKMEMAGWEGDKTLRQLLLMKPRLAYAASRQKGVGDLKTVLSHAIDAVAEAPEAQRPARFERFCQFFEAILAYHKAAGGK
ncbi:MAG: type III-A CRISPR-associated protein Csm2 [Deltaproteobacteria bacterium]|nr:type III-A CRISPR-associated protein Csm2 [Deltaproteobacteria bacterium]